MTAADVRTALEALGFECVKHNVGAAELGFRLARERGSIRLSAHHRPEDWRIVGTSEDGGRLYVVVQTPEELSLAVRKAFSIPLPALAAPEPVPVPSTLEALCS